MAISKCTLYKYIKVNGTWRHCKAAYHDNGKIKPDIVFVNEKEELLERHCEGRYYMSWSFQIRIGTRLFRDGNILAHNEQVNRLPRFSPWRSKRTTARN